MGYGYGKESIKFQWRIKAKTCFVEVRSEPEADSTNNECGP